MELTTAEILAVPQRYHPLPSDVVLVVLRFNGGNSTHDRKGFLSLIERIPLIGLMVLGDHRMQQTKLDIDMTGKMDVHCFIDCNIDVSSFRSVQLAFVNENLDVPCLLEFELTAQFFGAYEKLDAVIKRHKKREAELNSSQIKYPIDDVSNMYDWITVGPCNICNHFNDDTFRADGYTRISFEMMSKWVCLYHFRRLKKL